MIDTSRREAIHDAVGFHCGQEYPISLIMDSPGGNINSVGHNSCEQLILGGGNCRISEH